MKAAGYVGEGVAFSVIHFSVLKSYIISLEPNWLRCSIPKLWFGIGVAEVATFSVAIKTFVLSRKEKGPLSFLP